MSDAKSILTIHPVVAQTGESTGLPKPYWDVEKFNALIYNHGYHAYLERALRCPCVDRATGQPLVTCHNCMGRGWIFVDKRETRIVAQGMNNIRRNSEQGEVNRGTVRITARAVDRLGFMDRVMLDELIAWYTEILRPVEYNDELIAYPIYEPLEVSNMLLYIGAHTTLLPLTSDQYTISGNKIVFSSDILDLIPPAGLNSRHPDVSISIRYSYYPVYHIVDVDRELMKVRDLAGCTYSDAKLANMPILCEGRKAHYIFDAQIWDRALYDNTVVSDE